MKSGAITLKDMAKALDLSVSTISKALRNSYEISLDTKKLVAEYAAKNNYQIARERYHHGMIDYQQVYFVLFQIDIYLNK